MKKDLCTAAIDLDNDINIKVNYYIIQVIIVLSKLEKVFCAGANIKELSNCSFET